MLDTSTAVYGQIVYVATCIRTSHACHADESAAQLTPKELGQLNKELSTLQPVVDALTILAKQRQEVRHATSFIMIRITTSFITNVIASFKTDMLLSYSLQT